MKQKSESKSYSLLILEYYFLFLDPQVSRDLGYIRRVSELSVGLLNRQPR